MQFSVYFCNMLQQHARATFQVSRHTPADFVLLIRYHSDEAVSAIFTVYRRLGNCNWDWVVTGFVRRIHV